MQRFSLKMRGNSHRNSKYTKLRQALTLTAATLILVWAGYTLIGTVTATFTRGLLSVQTYLNTSRAALPVYIRERSELLHTIDDLQARLGAHSGDTATIERLARENSELRALLSTGSEPRIGAGVIGRPPTLPYDLVYLDRGSDDGIKEGRIVYHSDDHAIGYVSRVFSRSALVTLFSTHGTQMTVYVFGPNVYATAYGEGGGVVRIAIPQGLTVKEGDVVVLPTIDAGVLGTIAHVLSIPTEPEQSAYLTFTTPLQSMRTVGVGTRDITPISFDEAANAVDLKRMELFTIPVPEAFMLKSGTTSTSTLLEDIGTTSHESSGTVTPPLIP